MLVRGTTPHGEERLARARRLRRAVYILFFSFLLLILIGIPLFVSRFSQTIPPDDPAFIRQIAEPDAVWTFRPGPVAEHLFGDAVVPLDLTTALSTLHQHGQIFVYHPAQANTDPQWIVAIPRRRPQRLFNGALSRLFHLQEELDLSPTYHIDRHRLLIASDAQRMETFLQALDQAGEVPKVEERVVHEDALVHGNVIAQFRGDWQLLPSRLRAAITQLANFNPPDDTPIVLLYDRDFEMISLSPPFVGMEEQYRILHGMYSGPHVGAEGGQHPTVYLKGVGLDGDIEPGTPPIGPLGPGRTY